MKTSADVANWLALIIKDRCKVERKQTTTNSEQLVLTINGQIFNVTVTPARKQ